MFFTTIVGNVDECRTECEISDSSAAGVALVYEARDGWHVKTLREIAAEELDDFNASVIAAKENLSRYVNRMGTNAPEGLTAGGLSLWLMAKDDGTAMGIELPPDDPEAAQNLKKLSPEIERRIRKLHHDGHQLEAIRELRRETNCSLAQAKAWLVEK